MIYLSAIFECKNNSEHKYNISNVSLLWKNQSKFVNALETTAGIKTIIARIITNIFVILHHSYHKTLYGVFFTKDLFLTALLCLIKVEFCLCLNCVFC